MSSCLHVNFLPDELSARQPAGSVAVVIDVLRASTTIITALSNGASRVIPVESTAEARHRAASHRTQGCVTGGERAGVQIEGFDLGNSPTEYTREIVGGREVIFTTTNGTRALLMCQTADRIVVGAFVNLLATARLLNAAAAPIHLVCAGTDGSVTSEDVLYAGALIRVLTTCPLETADIRTQWTLTDAACIARDHWHARIRQHLPDSAFDNDQPASDLALSRATTEALRSTQGGRNLLQLNCGNDLTVCGQWNVTEVIPEFDPASGEIKIAAPPPGA